MPTDVAALQRALNRFVKRYLRGVQPLVVDGERGHATNRRILTAKFYLGWGGNRNADVDRAFLALMGNPHRKHGWPASQMRRTGMVRRARQKARWAQQHAHATVTRGVTRYDGRPVAAWLVPYLKYARAHGWQGRLNSGWRSPAYSRSLCMNMCGAPSCSGRCAGAASNHSGSAKPRGALDVSDYHRFGQLMSRCPLSPRIFCGLGSRDPVHFSQSGR